MYRPAADTKAVVRRVAVFVAVATVLLMHGLTCMAGTAHLAGTAPHAGASHAAMVTPPHAVPCLTCHHSIEPAMAGPLLTLAGDLPGGGHPSGHFAAVCAGLLLGLTLLSLLAAAARVTTRSPGAAAPRGQRVRPPPPTALLSPSLATLCVLRT